VPLPIKVSNSLCVMLVSALFMLLYYDKLVSLALFCERIYDDTCIMCHKSNLSFKSVGVLYINVML